MKTNLVHTLYQVQKFGTMPIEKFVDLLKPGEKKRCLQIGFPRSGTPYPRRPSRHSYSGYVAFSQRLLEFFKFQFRS